MAADDDPIELPECLAAGIGKDSKESIDKAFAQIFEDAKMKGIFQKGLSRVQMLLQDHCDVFRIKLGADPPVDVPPLVITPVDNVKTYRRPQRRCAPHQRDFTIQITRELEVIGAIYKNTSARWASPVLAVPKPGSTSLRFTVDLRGPNAVPEPIQSAMPQLESKLQDIAGSTCFANIDLAYRYWQVQLLQESQEMMSIQNPLGVYSSLRLLQGGSDSGNHFQEVLHENFDGRVKKMLQWIDDFLFFADNEEELLSNIEKIFRICSEIRLKVHAEKSNLFAKKVQFCGSIISSQGVQYHPRHFESLVAMKKSTKAYELQQLICATNWMRSSIQVYVERIAPLHQLLEESYSKAGKRTKRALRSISFASSWGADHDAAFDTIKKQLAASIKLAHPRSDHHMCLFTDASDTHWAAIITQVPTGDRKKEIEAQNNETLFFLSGAFYRPAANSSIPEKEVFAILEAMCRLDYLVMGHEVTIFTDHANLVYLYGPYGLNPGISRHTASKLMRWALKLSAFRYIVEHLPGERKAWDDMLTRWAVNPTNSVSAFKVLRSKSLMCAPINPGIGSQYDWTRLDEIIKSRSNSKVKLPMSFKITGEGFRNDKKQLWITPDYEQLKLRIIIAGHTAHGGHRSWRVTLASIQSHFAWTKMNEDVE